MTTEALFDISPSADSWHTSRLVGFDLETTGPDPSTALIVSAALVIYDPEHPPATRRPRVREWLVDPGVEIPAESTAVHGITTEHARAHGQPPEEALPQLLDALRAEFDAGSVIVVMNAPYDLTVLAVEARRCGLDFPDPHSIIDPLVIDKQVDKYRRGKRTLAHLCAHYGIVLDGAHSAAPDAEAAVDVARALARQYPQVQLPAAEIHALQAQWKAEQAADLQEYFRRTRPDAVVNPAWPM
ncbi:MAG TPA: 3'-5' exonuclease [Candidatus Nesterenkonia stercoripullorum]|uniref:3'-5' exonuclease n=1 Tax=Candidatus Nesterenkonia stercoripullorum TaxID=2838701 RepID=A0A9D1UVD2_9MICC|nr:3'-5' exonuclease [Candidatus Nesterenkonia stercoripullorum]